MANKSKINSFKNWCLPACKRPLRGFAGLATPDLLLR
jgi:hypothetical protein